VNLSSKALVVSSTLSTEILFESFSSKAFGAWEAFQELKEFFSKERIDLASASLASALLSSFG